MLIQVLPEQVSAKWEFFAPMIGKSLPPMQAKSVKGMSNILASVLREDLSVWIYEEDDNAYFILSTTVQKDNVSNKKFLLIYSLTGIREIKPRMWQEAYKTISRYAKSRGCESVIAYADDQKIVDFVESEGAKTDFTLIEMEI